MEQLKSTPSSSKPRKSYSKEYLLSFASLESCKKWPHNLDLAMQRDVNSELEVLEWRKSGTTLLSASRRSSIKCEKFGQRKINHKLPMAHSLGSFRTTYRTDMGKETLEEGMSRSYEDVNALSHEHINLEGVVDSEDMFALKARKRIVGFSPLVGLKEESNASIQVKVSQEMRLGNLSESRREDYSSDRSKFSSSFESCSNSNITQEPLTLLKMKESVDEENVPCTTVPKTILWRSLLTQNDLADNEETHIAAENDTSIKKVAASGSRLSDDLWHSLTGSRLDQRYSIDAGDNELQTKGEKFIDVVRVTEQNESHLVSDSDEASPVSNASTDLFIGSLSSSDQKIDLLEALFVLEGQRVLPMPAAPTLEDIEKDIISTTTSEMFLTCQDVEQSILADTKVSSDVCILGDGGSPTLSELLLERESNGINKAASEHILSLLQKGSGAANRLQGLDIREADNRAGGGEDAGNNESEKELFGELVSSKVPISSDLSNLDGVLQRYELIAAADFEQANKSVNKEANFGRGNNSQQACFAGATNIGMDNTQQAYLAYAAMVDSLRTSVDRGAVETVEAQQVKPKECSESIPKAFNYKAKVNSCDPSQKVSGEVEFFEHSCLKLKDSEAGTESESKRLTTRKLQKEIHKVSSTVSIAEASISSSGAVTFGVGGALAEQSSPSIPQRPVLGFQSPTTSFWQAMPPLVALVQQQQQQHWQHSAGNSVKLPQVGLLRPMSYSPTIMPPFMQTRPTTTPLVPQALQALQRLVDHQLEILNNIPGEVTPGMLHQRLSRSLYGIGPGFQQTGQQLLLAGFSPGITSSYAFTRHS